MNMFLIIFYLSSIIFIYFIIIIYLFFSLTSILHFHFIYFLILLSSMRLFYDWEYIRFLVWIFTVCFLYLIFLISKFIILILIQINIATVTSLSCPLITMMALFPSYFNTIKLKQQSLN